MILSRETSMFGQRQGESKNGNRALYSIFSETVWRLKFTLIYNSAGIKICDIFFNNLYQPSGHIQHHYWWDLLLLNQREAKFLMISLNLSSVDFKNQDGGTVNE
jgi:hypothetical protein